MTIELRPAIIAAVHSVQALPYRWPAPSDAAAARATGFGTCASKHALLAEELERLGIASEPRLVIGRLVPAGWGDHPLFRTDTDLLEVHECLSVTLPWRAGTLVDVTWDPPLVKRGLAGTLDWDGGSDMALALAPAEELIPAQRVALRSAKEGLRTRIYRQGDRDRRDRVLAALSALFAEWRSTEGAPQSSSSST